MKLLFESGLSQILYFRIAALGLNHLSWSITGEAYEPVNELVTSQPRHSHKSQAREAGKLNSGKIVKRKIARGKTTPQHAIDR